jgi:putative NADH-flavin reductase
MRLFLLGATGRTGLSLTSQALERGHTVTALVRSPDKVIMRHDRLRIVTGDPLDREQLARALGGHDTVVSAMGATSRAPTTVCGDSARSIIEAMQPSGVRRLLVISSALLYSDIGALGRIVGFFFRHVLVDARQMEARVEASNLDWTIVRPPRLTDGKPRGRYRVADGPPRAGSIARPDLARYMLDIAEDGAHLRKVLSVSK